MRRLRYGDWICALGAVCLPIVLSTWKSGWSSLGWFTLGATVLAILAALTMVLTTIGRPSPSAPLVSAVTALVVGFAADVALLAEAYWIGVVDATILIVGAYLAIRDPRSPGAHEPPVELRPAPPAV